MEQSIKDLHKKWKGHYLPSFKDSLKMFSKNIKQSKQECNNSYSAIDYKQIKCDKIAEQLFYDNTDCYTMIVNDISEIPAMSKEKFIQIVGKILYDNN